MLDCPEARTKICSRCGSEKQLTEFYTDSRREDGRRTVCKTCWAERKKEYIAKHQKEISEKNKQYYQANKERINRRVSNWRKNNHKKLMEQQRARRASANDMLAQIKTPCVKCGEERPWVIHFHHIDPGEKVFEITQEAIIYKKEDCIKAEVEKCACLCANCHTEFHHFFGKKPSDPKSAFERYLGGGVDV